MTHDSDNLIAVTPTHSINITNEIKALVDRPQQKDFVIRKLSSKMANGEPLIQGELVVSGHDTLNQFPLANKFPIHFRKTYYPTCFHQNPKKEFDYHHQASEHLHIAPPIGWTKTTFRSCFIPGIAYDKLSPFGIEPIEQNLHLGDEIPVPNLIGLWDLLVHLHEQITALHQNNMVHGDLFLHNVLVSTSPITTNLIDFELAKSREELKSEEKWEAKQKEDWTEIWKHAIFLQCALGPQTGPLAQESVAQINAFFRDPSPVQRRLNMQNKAAKLH